MVRRRVACEPGLLEGLLAGRLSGAEEDEVNRHIEECLACRESLEAMAAGASWWGDLRHLGDPASTRRDDDPGEAAAEDLVLGMLTPSEAPGSLGRLGTYEVSGVLGRGGMGVVLQAFDPTLHRLVAIKVLAPALATSASARRRFTREARAAASVSHDHVVAIHAVDEAAGLPFLVMPYVAGKSLQDRIDRSGPLEVKEVLRIGMQAASGLAAAHAQGLIHRDVKPANILLENGVERVWITDFGLARAADDASLTQSGVVAGTPQYMAPEQARGEAVDHRADLFSLGSVLYAMCTGRPPFRAESAVAVLRRVSDEDPRPVREVNPDVPDWLAATIATLHAKDPADRFQTAAEVAERLGQYLAHLQQPSLVPPPPRPPRPRHPGRSRRRRLGVAAAVVLIVLAGLSASEATGVTRVRDVISTVLRIRTADGTLVIAVDDPAIEVGVDDEGREIVIKGAGLHELRLKPGLHRLRARKDGNAIGPEAITVLRGGRQVIKIEAEPAVPAVAAGSPAQRPPSIPVVEGGPARRTLVAPSPAPRPLFIPRMEYHVRTYTNDVAPSPAPRPRSIPQPVPARLPVISPARTLTDLDAILRQVAIAPDGKTMLWGGKSNTLMITQFPDGPSRAIELIEGETWALAFAPDGKTFAHAGAWDGQIRIFETASTRRIASLDANEHAIRSIAYSPDGRLLASGSLGRRVRLWDVATGRALPAPPERELPVSGVAFTPDGASLAVSTGDRDDDRKPGELTLWDVASLELRGQHRDPRLGFTSMAIAPGGKMIAAGEASGTRLFDWPPDPMTSAHAADSVRLYNDVRFGPSATLRYAPEPSVRSVAFSPDGKLLACGVSRGDVVLWDVASPSQLALLKGHQGAVRELAFSPDGRWLASCGMDRRLMLWDLSSLSQAGGGPERLSERLGR